jgi:hypothetical protein
MAILCRETLGYVPVTDDVAACEQLEHDGLVAEIHSFA